MMTKEGPPTLAGETSQRLDKWLWFARIAKSRTLAATAVTEGKIKVNRVKAEKASQLVKVGDVITSRITRTIKVLKVVAIGTRRGPAPEAQRLYDDLTPPEPRIEKGEEKVGWAERAVGSGRPTKRERRQIEEFKRGS
jgi:ribosome-associated heat shock protein Hsp15